MITWRDIAGKTIYAASAAGAEDAVAATWAAGVYSMDADGSFSVFEQAGETPAAGDTALTMPPDEAQLATDQASAPADKRLTDTTIGGVAGTLIRKVGLPGVG